MLFVCYLIMNIYNYIENRIIFMNIYNLYIHSVAQLNNPGRVQFLFSLQVFGILIILITNVHMHSPNLGHIAMIIIITSTSLRLVCPNSNYR